jgi:hypothetical protein
VRSEDQVGDALDPAAVDGQQLIDRLWPSVAELSGESLVQPGSLVTPCRYTIQTTRRRRTG